MRTNRYHYELIKNLGLLVNSKSTKSDKTKNLLKNILVAGDIFLVVILPAAVYAFQHLDDKANLLLSIYQLSGFGGCLMAYIHLSSLKSIANNFFEEMERVVSERMKMMKPGLYEAAIEKAEKFVKYPVIVVTILIATNAVLTFAFSLIFDIVNGEINVDNWNMVFRMR